MNNKMNNKMIYLITLFTFVLTGLAAGCSTAQRSSQTMGEPKKVTLDLIELGEKIGVQQVENALPNGMTMKAQKWGKMDIKKAITELNYCFDEPENIYLLDGHLDPWVYLAIMEALKPLNVLMFSGPTESRNETGICELKRGKQYPNYDVVFEVVEEGDEVFINFNSDNPDPEASTVAPHTFDIANLCKVVIPEIPAGKHVFVHGKGMYPVMVCIAGNYTKDSKSVSLAAHETDYTCSFSITDEREIGDVKARTLPNNL